MRIQLLIDIETEDIPYLQTLVADQPPVRLNTQDGWSVWGRFMGAKEVHESEH